MTVVDSARRPAYPAAERLDLVEELHGRLVADPYRWLEDPADPRTVAWSRDQDGLARRYLDGLPGRDRLGDRLTALHRAGSVRPPVLQHATAGSRPVLLRSERDVGHGARAVSRTVRLAVDQLAFLADRLDPPA